MRRRAKYALIDLSGGGVLLVHLGMSGSLQVRAAEGYVPRPHDHVIIHLNDNRIIAFHDPRRFGLLLTFPQAEEAAHPLLAHLGPEPLSDDFSEDYLAQALRLRHGPIKPVLMDQRLVVGVGNIYASESLYLAGINPLIEANKAAKYADLLIPAIRATLLAAIDSGGSTLRDYANAQNEGGYFQHHFQVYGRENEACFRCAKPIRLTLQSGRATYWCDTCQPARRIRQKS